MTIKSIFCSVIGLAALLGIYGSSSLRMIRGTSLGPGMMPLIYSIVLFLLSVAFMFTGERGNKLSFKSFFKQPKLDGTVFYLLNLGMFLILYLFGTIPAMLLFCVAALLMLKKMKWKKAILFSIIWVAVLYIGFDKLLGVPFEQGVITKMLLA